MFILFSSLSEVAQISGSVLKQACFVGKQLQKTLLDSCNHGHIVMPLKPCGTFA
jgi:hypothetical protein